MTLLWNTGCSTGVCLRHFYRRMATRAVAQIDASFDDFDTVLARKKANRKLARRSQYCLPAPLVAALSRATDKWTSTELHRCSDELARNFHQCPVPLEKRAAHERALRLEHHYNQLLGDAHGQQAVRASVIRDLRARLDQWQPPSLVSPFDAAVFSLALLPRLYASALYCLRELRRLQPTFDPSSMLEYGGGAAAGLWAARATWSSQPHSLAIYLGVEESDSMQRLAVRLLQGGGDEDEEESRGSPDPRHQFTSLLDTAGARGRSLVLGHHCLVRAADFNQRQRVVTTLWNAVAPGGYLLLIEKGSNTGFHTVLEARRLLLSSSLSEGGEQRAVVMAPCPHQLACPRFTTSMTACHFTVPTYSALDLIAAASPKGSGSDKLPPLAPHMAKFSYLLVKKTASRSALESGGDAQQERTRWPRVVQPVLVRHNHVVCRLCSSRGNIDEVVVTKKHGKSLYHMVKNTQWGETIPVHLSDAPTSNKALRRAEKHQDEDLQADNSTEKMDHAANDSIEMRDHESIEENGEK